MTRLEFTKMHGLGNDFIVLEPPAGWPLPGPAAWRALAHRQEGIGFDQALVVLPARGAGEDAHYLVFNADGGEVEQCGNGARCVARFLQLRRGLPAGRELRLGSAGGPVQARTLADGRVAVDLGEPDFRPASLPFLAAQRESTYRREVAGAAVEFGAVSMGNPHVVLRVAAVDEAPVARIGGAFQSHADFPRQVNVGFMQVLDAGRIRLRVHERGVGETRACGTGACAAVAVGRDLGLLGADVEVHVPGGRLAVHWDGPGSHAWLSGPAAIAYEGVAEIG
jgi:diaminopimelate epimerase